MGFLCTGVCMCVVLVNFGSTFLRNRKMIFLFFFLLKKNTAISDVYNDYYLAFVTEWYRENIIVLN